VERLLDAVSGSDGRVATAALAAAESLGGATALLAGSRALSHPDVRVVRAALHALGEAGTRDAASLLVAVFRDARWEVRHAAAQALWRLRHGLQVDAEVLRRAQEALRDERDPLVREALGLALSAGGGAA
jgi:HEAT repeat protein